MLFVFSFGLSDFREINACKKDTPIRLIILPQMKNLFPLLAAILLMLWACQSASQTADEATSESAVPNAMRMYVGTSQPDTAPAIFTLRFLPADGSFGPENQFAGVRGPSFIAVSPDKHFVYSVNGMPGQKEGGVSAFAIDAANGGLSLLNQQLTKGRGPCYVSTDPTGKWVFVANYSSGSVSAFPVQADGSLGEASSWMQHEGSGPDASRQEGPHAHYFRMGPDGKVYSPDLGIDQVMIYDFDTKSGQLSTADPAAMILEPGSGPRHLDFHPNARWIYVLNELAGSVSVFDAETYVRMQTISTLPEGFALASKSADIHVHPNGKFLYASNRSDSSSIAVFGVDATTGLLTFVEREHAGINWPRNFTLDPSGQYVISANANDNTLTSYLIDEQTGALSPTGHQIEVPKPMCIQWE